MPTMPTNAQWVDAWQALTISGVTVMATPPQSLSTAQLPAAWPELPEMSQADLLVSCTDENKARFMTFRIAIEPIGQNLPSINYEAVVTLLDTVETAVETLRTNTINFIDYTIRGTAEIRIAGETYWGLDVEATGRNVRF